MEKRPLWRDAATIPVRRLTYEDLSACTALAEDRGWDTEEPKWRFLFEAADVYGVDDPAGDLVGCYTLTRYGTEYAAIGMVLVAERYGGRGLGRRLMTHALEVAGDATVSLYATEYGRPLYEKLGFDVVDGNSTHLGSYGGSPRTPASRPVAEDELPAVLDYDAGAFGADRADMLTTLYGVAKEFRLAERRGRVRGYAAAWRNTRHLVIGPVVADDLPTATGLIADIAAGATAPVRVDVRHTRTGLAEWLTAAGIPPAFDGTFMVRDGAPENGDPARLFAPLTQAV